MRQIARMPKPKPPRAYRIVAKNLVVTLKPNGTVHMTQNLPIDQIDTLTIKAVDAQGNVVPFTPDAPPVWTDSVPSAVSAAPSADGLSDVLTGLVIGASSIIGVTVKIGGVTYNVQDTVDVMPGAIAGIKLVHTLSPKS